MPNCIGSVAEMVFEPTVAPPTLDGVLAEVSDAAKGITFTPTELERIRRSFGLPPRAVSNIIPLPLAPPRREPHEAA